MSKIFGRQLIPEEFSAEVVRRAHLDRVANGIAEDVSCYIRSIDPNARTDLNCALTRYDRDVVKIWGEVYSDGEKELPVNIRVIARDYVRQVGYTATTGFDYENFDLDLKVKQQSKSLTANANSGRAGDTRTVWGFACKYDDSYFGSQTLSAPEQICRRLVDSLDFSWSRNPFSHFSYYDTLSPDGKVTVKLDNSGTFHITYQLQHDSKTNIRRLREYVYDNVFLPTRKDFHLERFKSNFAINGAASVNDHRVQFVQGGTRADSGTSNHKLLAYGEALPSGGGGPWGKDFSKPEKSGWLMARHIAHSIATQGIADVAKVGLGYEIGSRKPRVFVYTYGTLHGHRNDEHLASAVENNFDLSPQGIADYLNLRDTQQFRLGVRTHIFGDPEFRWEQASTIV